MAGTASTLGAGGEQLAPQPSIRRFLLQHKWISLAVLAVIAVMVGTAIPEVVTAGRWKVNDSTSCSAWSSANPRQQRAYAHLYVQRHGSLSNGATSPASIEDAVNKGCLEAFGYDEADQVTVLQAINGQI
jgi:hypothetical protein